MKNFFLLKDNIIDKKLEALLNRQQFASKKIVNSSINELIDFFAKHFSEGDTEKAHTLLEKHNAPIRKKDAILISYFSGFLTMTILFLIVLLWLPAPPN